MSVTVGWSMVPKTMRFQCRMAFRHLSSGGGQTLLTLSAVAAGVVIVIFITALIVGSRQSLTSLLTESLPHITLQIDEVKPTPLDRLLDGSAQVSSSRIARQALQQKYIDDWPQAVALVQRMPNVRLVAPMVKEAGVVAKGGKTIGVSVVGAEPRLQDEVVPISKHLIAGRYLELQSEEMVIDAKLSQDLDVIVGDRLRLTSSRGTTDTFTIAGIYSSGLGRNQVYVTLRTAQSLAGLGTSVNIIFVKLIDIFEADRIADHIMALLPYKATSWSREFPDFRTSLHAQSAVVSIISAFSLMASSFAIASVLVVSVLQKSKQIGILKSMGARRQQIFGVFVLEGLIISCLGSVIGALLGISMVSLLGMIHQPVAHAGQTAEPLFPVAILPVNIVLAILAAIVSTVIAALLPARRAARLNPVEALR